MVLRFFIALVLNAFCLSTCLMCFKQEMKLKERKSIFHFSSIFDAKSFHKKHEIMNCDRSCHTNVNRVEGHYILSLGCDEEGPSIDGCSVQLNGSAHCTCYLDGCNEPGFFDTNDALRKMEIHNKKNSAHKTDEIKIQSKFDSSHADVDKGARACKKYEGYFNIQSGEFVFDSIIDIMCYSDCTTTITNDNVRIYTVNGGCNEDYARLRMHKVTVGEQSHHRKWFHHSRVEQTTMSCMAHSDGSRRFLTCTCADNECNAPDC